MIDAVYIMANFPNGIDDQVYNDITLLHLDKPLPTPYKPVELITEGHVPDYFINSYVWMGGYGNNETQTTPEHSLTYRRQIIKPIASKHRDFLLATASEFTKYKDELSSWQVIGNGDSGGPVFFRSHHGMVLTAIISRSSFCNYAGYFAKVPKAFYLSIQISPYEKIINEIIDGTAKPEDVRCFSTINGCSRNNLYVLNNDPYNQGSLISTYSLSNTNSYKMQYISSAKTGEYPTQIALHYQSNGKVFAFVANYLDSSISHYRVNISGELTKMPNDLKLAPTGTPVDIKVYQNRLYVTEHKNKQVTVFNINPANGDLSHITDMPTSTDPMSMTIIGKFGYVANDGGTYGKNKSISVYNLNTNTHLYNQPLPDSIGEIIQIIKKNNNQLYLLTTKGIYIYSINTASGIPQLTLYLDRADYTFDISSILQPISDTSFAVSSGIAGSVIMFSVNSIPALHPAITQINNYHLGVKITGISFADIPDYIGMNPEGLFLSLKPSNTIAQYDKQFEPTKLLQAPQPTTMLFKNWTIPASHS